VTCGFPLNRQNAESARVADASNSRAAALRLTNSEVLAGSFCVVPWKLLWALANLGQAGPSS
jgi:hypothetical protein